MSIFSFKSKGSAYLAKDLDQIAIDSFKPSYIWPSEYIPFRKYYESKNCRIFIIENLTHNWNWLKDYSQYFRETDFFYVSLGWYHTEFHLQEMSKIFSILGLNRKNFIFMFNDFHDQGLFTQHGFNGELINQNCFIDENIFQIRFEDKSYNAIYTSRIRPFKRHYLASKVARLALVVGQAWEVESSREDLPENVYINTSVLTPTEVSIQVSKSKVGLILSEMEGACYSSSEYLLLGIPVVSTWSKGGREVWYNDYNSIVCNPNEDEVAEAVTKMCQRNIDSTVIRGGHLSLARKFRNKFIESIDNTLVECGDRKIGQAYFKKNFINKNFIKQIPKFQELFPAN